MVTMNNHVLEVYRYAMQNGLDARAEVRDYLAEKDTHISQIALDRLMSRLADEAYAELKEEIAADREAQ